MSRKILEHPKCRPGKTRPCVVLQRHMHHSSNYYLNVGQKSHYSLTHLILHFLTEPDHSALLAINAHHEFLFQWQKGILLIEICIEPQGKIQNKQKIEQIATSSRTMRNVKYEITLRHLKLQKTSEFCPLDPWTVTVFATAL